MARVEEGEKNDTKAALDWLKRAADNAATGDRTAVPPHWQCGNCGHVPPQWMPTCPACNTFAAVSWQGPARALVPVVEQASAA